MAVRQRVHTIECYMASDNDWNSQHFEESLHNNLNGNERIVDIRWPTSTANPGYCWVITEELIMGPVS